MFQNLNTYWIVYYISQFLTYIYVVRFQLAAMMKWQGLYLQPEMTKKLETGSNVWNKVFQTLCIRQQRAMAPEKNEESSNRTNLLHAENFQNAEHEGNHNRSQQLLCRIWRVKIVYNSEDRELEWRVL